MLVTQTIDNIDSALRSAITTNCNILAMSPREAALVESYLPAASGRIVDPLQPDRTLSEAAERQLRRRQLLTLPARHGAYIDRRNFGITVFRARNFPFERVSALAAQVSEDARMRFRAGKYGVPRDELVASAVDPVLARLGEMEAPADVVFSPRQTREPPQPAPSRPRRVVEFKS
jgi:hypothetical protein